MSFGDQPVVPGAAILLVEGDEFPAGRNAGGASCLGEQHERQEPGDRTVPGEQAAEEPGEPDRPGGQVRPDWFGVGPGRQVPLVEDEEEHGEHPGETSREVRRGGYSIRDAP